MKLILITLTLSLVNMAAFGQFSIDDEFVTIEDYYLTPELPILNFFVASNGELLDGGLYEGWTFYSFVMSHKVDHAGVNIFYSLIDVVNKGDSTQFKFNQSVGGDNNLIPYEQIFRFRSDLKDGFLTLTSEGGHIYIFKKGKLDPNLVSK